MPKPSPQLILSAASSALAMAALALNAPAIGGQAAGAGSALPAVALFETPALPGLPAVFPR